MRQCKQIISIVILLYQMKLQDHEMPQLQRAYFIHTTILTRSIQRAHTFNLPYKESQCAPQILVKN